MGKWLGNYITPSPPPDTGRYLRSGYPLLALLLCARYEASPLYMRVGRNYQQHQYVRGAICYVYHFRRSRSMTTFYQLDSFSYRKETIHTARCNDRKSQREAKEKARSAGQVIRMKLIVTAAKMTVLPNNNCTAQMGRPGPNIDGNARWNCHLQLLTFALTASRTRFLSSAGVELTIAHHFRTMNCHRPTVRIKKEWCLFCKKDPKQQQKNKMNHKTCTEPNQRTIKDCGRCVKSL